MAWLRNLLRRSPGSRARRRTALAAEPSSELEVPPATPPAAGDAGPVVRRRLTYLMLFRMGFVTLLLGATVAVVLSSEQTLGRLFSQFLLSIVLATYVLALLYAIALYYRVNILRLAKVQFAGDLAVATVLVHASGGAESGFAFMYLLTVIGAATVLHRYGAMVTAILSGVLYGGVSVVGYLGFLPLVPGQTMLPWEMAPQTLVRALVLNLGALVAVAWLANNLSEQVREASLRIADQRMSLRDLATLNEHIVHSLDSGLITVDPSGTIGTFNAAAEALTGLPARQALGSQIGDSLPRLAATLDSAPATGVAAPVELTLSHPDADERQLEVWVSVLRDHQGRDVGRLVNLQDQTILRRMEARMLRAERMAAVGRLSAAIAHEVRNPLAAISGAVELLGTALPASEENKRLTEIVLGEVERLNRLVSDLLQYARPRPLELAPTDLRAHLEEVLSVFQCEPLGRRARVHAALGADPLVVSADSASLRQVFWNLLVNASEAMPEGGELSVRLEHGREQGPTAQTAPAEIRVSISDHGSGIEAQHIDHVFEPFYTTKDKGTGLGLAIVHRLVEDHGGSILVDSRPGEGTTFTVCLPAGTACVPSELAAAVASVS